MESTSRAYFFDEDDARDVARKLGDKGWEYAVTRDTFQGEDDDEDQPWVVTSDAPAMMLEMLADEAGGWFDHGAPTQTVVTNLPPLNLPSGPKRIKRPDLGSGM